MRSTDTAIIGAGPYGLSLATYLKAAGVPHQVLGQPMCAWRHFTPPGMIMRSEAFASNLYAPQRGYTVEDYCRLKRIDYQPVGMILTRETFIDYGLWFQSNLVGETRAVDVVDMGRSDGFFRLSLSDGSELMARRVVMALGLKGFAYMPPMLRGLPRTHVSHSAEYGDLAWAEGKDIAIVGGGQSALGLAAVLCEIGARVQVLVRDRSVHWHPRPDPAASVVTKWLYPDAGLGSGWLTRILSEYPFLFHALGRRFRNAIVEKSFGPAGGWWLRDRVVGKAAMSFHTEVRSATIENDDVILRVVSRGKESCVAARHVIVATGFRTDMTRHTFMSKEVMDAMSLVNGMPELTSNFETSVPGLYVVGPASAHSFGPVMRFTYGAKHAAPRVAWHIDQTLRRDARRVEWLRTGVHADALKSGARLHDSGRGR
jgi:thioredoxin reductase